MDNDTRLIFEAYDQQSFCVIVSYGRNKKFDLMKVSNSQIEAEIDKEGLRKPLEALAIRFGGTHNGHWETNGVNRIFYFVFPDRTAAVQFYNQVKADYGSSVSIELLPNAG